MHTTRYRGVLKVTLRTLVLAAAALAAAAVLAPLAQAASTVFVSPAPVKGPFNSCATPGYKSIQEAISVAPPKTTVHVCAGTYNEQVKIEKPDTIAAEAGATLMLPASPANTVSTCDVQEGGYEEQVQVLVCGAGKVSIAGLSIDSKWTEINCAKQDYGILVGGNSQLTLTNTSITHAGPEPINGCQSGVGLQIGHNKNGQVASAKLSGDQISGYQKNGITIDGAGSKAKINGVTIKGEPTEKIATNGIQVSRGATAKITGSTIEGNECNVASACGPNEKGFSPWQEEEDATGILFYLAGSGSQVKGSTINGNDIGVYNLLAGSEAAKTTITGNHLSANRFWGISLDQGSALVSNNTIKGPGLVGIQIVQYGEPHQFREPEGGEEFGARGAGKGDAITGMSACALEGLSDNSSKDPAGSLTITKSLAKFSGNTSEVCDNNTSGKLPVSVT
jgi:nitrous oxidase accessory protein NosD